MKTALARWDERLYGLEKRAVSWIFLLMGAAVFADVVHRVFSRTPGRLASILAGWTGMSAEALDRGLAPTVIALVLFGLAYAAWRTRGADPRASLVRAIGAALALTVLVQAFIRILPQGVVWAPYFGLSALLWSGLIGASMATYSGQHLALEMGEKLWPKKARPWVRSASRFVAGLFAALVAVLGAMSVAEHFADWRSGPGAGLIPSIDWPKWAVFLVVPYAFGMIAFRLLGQALNLVPERKP